MNNIILEYRDPLLGVIFLVTLVFLISFFTYSFGIYKEKKARRDYRKLSKRFELGNLQEEDYVHLYKTYNLPFDSILLLASSFIYKGDYNKAINVYLTLLEHVKDRVKKEELLELLGKTYYKGGFLIRSKDIFLRILKFSPRNKQILYYLLYVYEKLKDFKKAKEVSLCLEELEETTNNDSTYLDCLIIINDSIISFEKKTHQLYEIFKNNKIVERVFISFLLQYNKTFFWEHINEFDCKKVTDLMWYLNFDDIDFDKAMQNSFLEELFNAKAYLDTIVRSDDFDFDLLILINKNEHSIKASLDFEFICTNCKHSNPIFEDRCPHCHKILSFEIKHNITREYYEKNQSLQ